MLPVRTYGQNMFLTKCSLFARPFRNDLISLLSFRRKTKFLRNIVIYGSFRWSQDMAPVHVLIRNCCDLRDHCPSECTTPSFCSYSKPIIICCSFPVHISITGAAIGKSVLGLAQTCGRLRFWPLCKNLVRFV